MGVYYVWLRACYRLPRPVQLYPNFEKLRARHEGINNIDAVLHKPLKPASLPAPAYEVAPAPAPKEGPGPEEPIPEQQNALENPPEPVPQWNPPKEPVD